MEGSISLCKIKAGMRDNLFFYLYHDEACELPFRQDLPFPLDFLLVQILPGANETNDQEKDF